MDLLAFAGIVLAVVVPLVGALWHLLKEKIEEHKDTCDKDIAAIWDQIGRDSGSGMRRKVHQSVDMGAHFELERRVHELELRVERKDSR